MSNEKTGLKMTVKIPLNVPLTVTDAEGKEAKRDTLIMHRPTFVHAKMLSLVIGPEFFKAILSDATTGRSESDKKAGKADVDVNVVVSELIAALASQDGLDGLTNVFASMCNEAPELLDQLDWLDLMPVAQAVFGFFPALQSIVPTK